MHLPSRPTINGDEFTKAERSLLAAGSFTAGHEWEETGGRLYLQPHESKLLITQGLFEQGGHDPSSHLFWRIPKGRKENGQLGHRAVCRCRV